ncbi:MAG TPA: prepilin-type N-terminal cleavage/methylation domain-containing protein [Opitutus sp.]|nr:prepilin-type N-terminal cleavage/methylation domain-containing protein [Opitutus sp.]
MHGDLYRSRAGGISRSAFTLIELLVVVALIAGLAALFIAGVGSGSKAGALQSAQATMANLIMAARAKAMASGMRVRILVHADTRDVARFRRFIAMQQETSYLSNAWRPAYERVSLPEGICVLPRVTRVPSGFYAGNMAWTKTSVADPLHSSALDMAVVSAAVDRDDEEVWEVIQFTPFGTMSTNAGDVVLATVVRRAPGSFAEGESPVRAEDVKRVRGMAISTYGVPMLLNGRAAF